MIAYEKRGCSKTSKSKLKVMLNWGAILKFDQKLHYQSNELRCHIEVWSKVTLPVKWKCDIKSKVKTKLKFRSKANRKWFQIHALMVFRNFAFYDQQVVLLLLYNWKQLSGINKYLVISKKN